MVHIARGERAGRTQRRHARLLERVLPLLLILPRDRREEVRHGVLSLLV